MRVLLYIAGIAAIVFLFTGCGRIETGHVGVRTDFNKTIETTEVPPGWYGAVFTNVDDFVVKEVEVSMNNLKPKAKDNLSLADLDISIFYTVNPNKVADLVIKYVGMSPKSEGWGGAYLPAFNLVERYTRGSVYDTVSEYDSLTIHTKRSDLERSIQEKIQNDLNKSDPETFTITKVIVRQLLTDPTLEQSIQQAVRVQKDIEAKKQQVELAIAEAERQRVEAEGTAAANRIISASINNQLIELRRVEAMAAFAHEGTHTVVLPAETKALVNIAK
jgi:regulator of protease activity HflC (stomatin/prohibitin superfamily)